MAVKMTTHAKHNAILMFMVLLFVALLIAATFVFRWFSQATMPQNIVSPRPGIECLVVSGADGVAVSCYPTAGLPPRIAKE